MSDGFSHIKFSKLLNKRFLLLLIILLMLSTLIVANKISLLMFTEKNLHTLTVITIAIALLISVKVIIKFTEKKIFNFLKDELAIEERIFMTKLYKFFLYFVVLTVILLQVGVTLSSLTIYLGFITTGLAFAIREILLSYFIWIILLQKKPFRIGDYIEMQHQRGIVDRIGSFYVTLIDIDHPFNKIIKIPNKFFLENSIVNMGTSEITQTIKIPLKYLVDDYKKRNDKLIAIANKNGIKEIRIGFEQEKEFLYLEINYLVELKRNLEIKNLIFQTAYTLYKGITYTIK